ncbi:MAG: hypothetical protein H0Z24_08735 [Thermosipho sp. (in: Bacteria)]|nr:hypothetical protein [Thermosipho sp. (in: thermotogales)]
MSKQMSKLKNSEFVEQKLEQLKNGVSEFLNSEKWKEYLSFQAKFHSYSFNNVILMLLQWEERGKTNSITKVAGAKTWEKLGRFVKDGEKPLIILAPNIKVYTKVQEDNMCTKPLISKFQEGKQVEAKGYISQIISQGSKYGIYVLQTTYMVVKSRNGKVQFEEEVEGTIIINSRVKFEVGDEVEVEGRVSRVSNYKKYKQLKLFNSKKIGKREVSEVIESRVLVGFFPVEVYDVSQTEGKEIPELCNEIQGTSEQAEKLLDVLRNKILDIPVVYEPMQYNGYYQRAHGNLENRIALKEGLSINHQAKTLIHETCHYIMDQKKQKGKINLGQYTEPEEGFDGLYAVEEVVVESVAFIVSQYFNLDTSEYSFEYVSSWSKGNPNKVLEVGKLIRQLSNELIEKLENALNGEEKEQKIA